MSEARRAISRLKTNKAADYVDLTSEHLNLWGHSDETYLLNNMNDIFGMKRVSLILKSGLITPFFKKGEKTNPANYRGITVTSVQLKFVEHILNNRHNIHQEKSQKTFEVVDHYILLKLWITGDVYLLLKDMYTGLTLVVKWETCLSSLINIRQGAHQGEVLSTRGITIAF